MTDKEIEEAREAGKWAGEVAARLDNLTKRVGRLENGVLGVLTGAAYFWAKAAGLVP